VGKLIQVHTLNGVPFSVETKPSSHVNQSYRCWVLQKKQGGRYKSKRNL